MDDELDWKLIEFDILVDRSQNKRVFKRAMLVLARLLDVFESHIFLVLLFDCIECDLFWIVCFLLSLG